MHAIDIRARLALWTPLRGSAMIEKNGRKSYQPAATTVMAAGAIDQSGGFR
jgi:hypothetical protein